MQDDSNLRQPIKKHISAKGKYIYPNLWQPPKIKCLLRKNILLLISYTLNTMCVRFYLPLPISITVSIFSHCLYLPNSPNIPILLTAFPQHIIISPFHCIGYTALHKTLQSPLLVRCTAMPLWYMTTKYYIYISWFTDLLKPMNNHNFLHRWC